MSDELPDALDQIEASRAKRKAALAVAQRDQRVHDLKAVDELELRLGDSNVALLEVPFTPGLPTLAAVRCPTSTEIKRYQDRIKPRKDGSTEAIKAAEELAGTCLVYPEAEVYAKLLEARPAIHVQLGAAAVQLAVGRAENEKKD